MKCKVKNCKNKYKTKGYCNKHHQQILKFGKIKRTQKEPNKLIAKNNICKIVLYNKNGIEKARAIIDLEDVEKCKKYKWSLSSHNYIVTKLKNDKILYLHHFISRFKNIDHINNNRFDNRKENLRKANSSQNSMNRTKRKNCTSKYKGVCWDKSRKKWRTTIKINNKQKHLGHFTNEIKAVLVYDIVAKKYFGKFALLNNIKI